MNTHFLNTLTKITHNNKYTKWYILLIQSRKSRSNSRKEAKKLLGYVEEHHIIPRCLFSHNETKLHLHHLNKDDKNNIVYLTPEEHYTAHLLLTQMVTKNSNLYHTLLKPVLMMATKTGSRSTNKLVGWVKRNYAISISGENNVAHKNRIITNGSTNKYIPKSEPIPEGWRAGKTQKPESKPRKPRKKETKPRKPKPIRTGKDAPAFGKSWKLSDETKRKQSINNATKIPFLSMLHNKKQYSKSHISRFFPELKPYL